jgi:hypothetical protein
MNDSMLRERSKHTVLMPATFPAHSRMVKIFIYMKVMYYQ